MCVCVFFFFARARMLKHFLWYTHVYTHTHRKITDTFVSISCFGGSSFGEGNTNNTSVNPQKVRYHQDHHPATGRVKQDSYRDMVCKNTKSMWTLRKSKTRKD